MSVLQNIFQNKKGLKWLNEEARKVHDLENLYVADASFMPTPFVWQMLLKSVYRLLANKSYNSSRVTKFYFMRNDYGNGALLWSD